MDLCYEAAKIETTKINELCVFIMSHTRLEWIAWILRNFLL